MTYFNLPDRDEMEIQMQKRIAKLEEINQGLRAENIALNRDILKYKKAEESSSQNEQRFRLKLENGISSTRKITNLELSEIIDVQAIQSLMDDFYKLTHIPIGLNDLKGKVLVSVGWQDICTKFHRVHPETCKHCVESNIKLSAGVLPGKLKMYKCKSNMWDVVTPIMVGDQHVGYVFGGQFFFEDESLDYEFFLSQARQYGFNVEEYIAALEKVPRLSREAVNTGMAFLMTFANMISQLSYSNIKLSQSLAERDVVVDALKESEKREKARSEELAAVLDAVPVSVYIAHDPQALNISGNRLSYEWLQVPIGTNFSKSAPEGKKPEFFKLFKDGREILPEKMPSQMAAAGKEVNDCELDIVSADGNIRHVLGNARPLHDEQGNLRGSVSAFIDITERKKAEEKIKRLADVVESSNDIIITESLDGIITSWNKGAEQAYGYLAEEVLGKYASIIEPDIIKGEIKQLVEKIKQGERIQHYETLRLKKDGTIINISLTYSPVFDTYGELVATSIIARDVTEKKIAEKLLQEKRIAEVANRAKSEFLANMSHELRTPLNSIIGFSDMLYEQAYGKLTERQLRAIENISQSGKHLLNLINDLLDLSKIEAGKLELDYKDFEIAAKLKMIQNLLSPIADRKNIKIEIDIDSELKRVCADESRFAQIMYNLVDNAIKFSYENSIVKIRARKKEDMVEIIVEDTGIGIKPEDQNKLFKQFSQIGSFSSKIFQGTGLGLSLVKQIVHLHGGYVWFRSNSNKGSTFAFTLPVSGTYIRQ